jgi:hypothetical protein
MVLAYRSANQPIRWAVMNNLNRGSLPEDCLKSGTTKVQPSAESAAGAVGAEVTEDGVS